jgi:excisionase family DNA binding protein
MRMLKPAELAERWDCTPTYVLNLIKSGQLPAVAIGKRMWRVKEDDAIALETSAASPVDIVDCHVYVIRCERYVKIGKAIDIEKRVSALSAANPFDIETVATFTNCDGHRFELELHRIFAEYRHKGEWFRLEGRLMEWIAGKCEVLPSSANSEIGT